MLKICSECEYKDHQFCHPVIQTREEITFIQDISDMYACNAFKPIEVFVWVNIYKDSTIASNISATGSETYRAGFFFPSEEQAKKEAGPSAILVAHKIKVKG